MSVEKLEEKIRQEVDNIGGQVFELAPMESPAARMKFLVITLNGGHVGFVGLRSQGGGVHPKNRDCMRQLRDQKCTACILSREEDIQKTLMYILSDAGSDPYYQIYRMAEKHWKEELS